MAAAPTSKTSANACASPISSPAAKYNKKTLKALRTALKKDPAADIISLLPRYYSDRLSSYKAEELGTCASVEPPPDDDVRSKLCINDQCSVIIELSSDLKSLLSHRENMPEALVSLLAESEVMYKSAWAASRTVLRISETLVVKITSSESTIHEGRTLSYLQKHSPQVPAPKLHGLMKFGERFLLFTTFEGSHNLEELWPHLDPDQKRSISTQLSSIMSQLRSIPHPEDVPIGKVGGRCEDIRRGSRTSHQAIMDAQQFDDFIFSGATRATPTYLRFLRGFVPASSAQCYFTHGDIKPGNIIVDQNADLNWEIVAIIDWENSGFYPAYWESIKMTNNLTPSDDDDWYLHLPEPFSPHQYPVRWLLDRVLDMSLQHS